MTNEKRDFFRVLIASSIGGIMEFYDFVLFILFAGIISQVFISPEQSPFLALLMTYTMFAVGYFVRPLGCTILAHFGDKYGRKKIFTLTVFLMAVPTFLIGVLPTYSQIGPMATILLLILRICQGLAVGGEIPGSSTFVYEHMANNRKAIGLSSLFSGLVGGVLLGSLIGALITHTVSKEVLITWGWRIPFLLGGVMGLIGIYIRTKLSESPTFKAMEKFKQQSKMPFIEVFKEHKTSLFSGIFTTLFIASSFTTFYMYTTSYMTKIFHYSYSLVLTFNTLGLVLFILSMLIWAVFIDKYAINIKKPFILSGLTVIILSIPFFMIFKTENNLLIALMYLIFAAGFGPGVGIFTLLLTKSFPAKVRFTGVSISYNVSFAVFGGLTPIINSLLFKKFGVIQAPAYYAILAAIIGIIACFTTKFINEEENQKI
ncbi:MAG: MFS transporter [Victivallales bacterium]|nr:MFS transporter [Victivallales bacterium]MCF7889320.1 MFS transporter [Victivallales bacterium]